MLGERCGVPRRHLEIKTDKPAVEQIVPELPDELPFAPNRIEELQQQRAQLLLGRNRQATRRVVERLASLAPD